VAGLKFLNVKLIKRMKRLILKVSEYKLVFISVVFLVILSFGCAKKDEKEIKIGAILPLTGDYAMYGKYDLQGIELALDDAINEGTIPKGEIKLFVEDGQTDPAKGTAAFLKLVNANKVSAVIAVTSGIVLAIKPIANKKKVVLINASAISTEIENADDYCFSVIPSAEVEGSFLAEFAFKKLDKRNAGILYRNDQSGISFKNIFARCFTKLGGEIVYEEPHLPEERDFRTYITKISAIKEMNVLFMASYGPEVALYLRQAKELRVSKQVLTYTPFYSPKVLEIGGSAVNGVFFTVPNFDPNSSEPIIEELKRKVLEKYNQSEVNYYIASHYDAMSLLIDAIKHGNNSGESIRQYIRNLDSFAGITGHIEFDKNGAAYVPMKIFTVQDLKFVEFEK